MGAELTVSRREFVRAGALGATSLFIAFRLPGATHPGVPKQTASSFAPNALLEISDQGVVTVWVTKSEMGQGVRTSLPMILADELDADWSKVRIAQADADFAKYGDQGTGGSDSVHSMWNPLRKAGAQARTMLVAAAATGWKVTESECRTEAGFVTHPASNRKASYGDLVADAAKQPVPENPTLKSATDYKLIGRSVPRLDTATKVDGSAMYGLDHVVPNMKFSVVARCPVFGGKMTGYDAKAAREVPGVVDVVEVPTGVAVIADNTWAAIQGRNALACSWDNPEATRWNSERISRMLHARADQIGALARNDGDAFAAFARSAKRIEAVYEVPYLAHATMEPMNCLADVRGDKCELWAPNQWPDGFFGARGQVAEALGVPPENVTMHVTMMGGGFGRRLLADYVVESAQISKAAKVPVKLVWTREDDMQHDWYRPASVHRMWGALDGRGRPVAWVHRVAAQSISEQHWPGSAKGGLDEGAVDGAEDLRYDIPNLRVEYCMLRTPVPVSWWRSVYASQTAFANECFVDELAHAAGQDPVAFRRAMLQDSPRHLAVLNLAAEKAGWGKPAPGRSQGIAFHHFFSDSVVAEVAEVSVSGGQVRVHRVVCAIDCGTVINPDGVKAQLESAVVYGLSAALKGAITVEEGRVKQTNFHDYPVLRMNEMPVIETHIIASREPPMGVGEPGTPPIAPAVANAVFAATGKRIRELPIRV